MAIQKTEHKAAPKPTEEGCVNCPPPPAVPMANAVPANDYYKDTIAKAGEPLPPAATIAVQEEVATQNGQKKSHIDIHYENLSLKLDTELAKERPNYERMLATVHKIIALMMRQHHKADHDYLHEVNIQLKEQTMKIKCTYNTWTSMSITVFSSAISIFGGAAGISPLFPKLVAAETAKSLAASAYSVSGAGQGVQSIGQIFDKRTEGERFVEQQNLKHLQDKEEARKGAKHQNTETGKETLRQKRSVEELEHQTFSTMASAG